MSISDDALDLISNKPRFWQHKVLAQVLSDEIQKCSDIRKKHKSGQLSLPEESIPEENFPHWFSERLNERERKTDELERTFELLARLAFGDTHQKTEVNSMIDLALEIGRAYRETINWSQRFRSLSMPPMYRNLLKEAARYSETLLQSMESLPRRIRERLADFEKNPAPGRFYLDIIVDFRPGNSAAFAAANHDLQLKYKRKFGV